MSSGAGVQMPQRNSNINYFLRVIRTGVVLDGFILLTASLLRLWNLDIKPPHFVEGINGWFVDQMKISGYYRYDPENYHGPLYFYVLFVFLSLLGRNLWALRLPAVISCIAAVWIALRLDRFFGHRSARLGALALALSPAAVFYGRYAIHESMLVLALMITTWGILGLLQDGRCRELIVTVIGVSLMLLIKETALIHLGCFVLSGGCLFLWQRIVPVMPPHKLAKQTWSGRDLVLCCSLSLFALLFFYSGTFLNWAGAGDFFLAYSKWFNTGSGAGGHIKEEYQLGPINYYWIALMGRYEWPSLLGLAFAIRLAFPAPILQRYLAIYGIGTLIAYSIIPYKTPWCIISLLWPFSILFGCAVEEVRAVLGLNPFKTFGSIAVASLLLGVSMIMTIRLNFLHFVDPKEPYVYVQTQPGISVVTDPVLGMAARDPRNHSMGGQIVLESYYPLPWIFGDFTRIGYYGKDEMPATLDGDFIVALSSQQKLVESRLLHPYLRRHFQLRDSMDECTVWFREALFGRWFSEPAHGSAERVVPAGAPSNSPVIERHDYNPKIPGMITSPS